MSQNLSFPEITLPLEAERLTLEARVAGLHRFADALQRGDHSTPVQQVRGAGGLSQPVKSGRSTTEKWLRPPTAEVWKLRQSNKPLQADIQQHTREANESQTTWRTMSHETIPMTIKQAKQLDALDLEQGWLPGRTHPTGGGIGDSFILVPKCPPKSDPND